MEDLRIKYEEKFNRKHSNVKGDESWKRYYGGKIQERRAYSLSFLYGNVLEVGSADGFNIYLMLKTPEIDFVTGLEIQDKAIIEAESNLKGIGRYIIKKGIAEEMPFKDNSFDCGHCGATMEHVFDDKLAAKEMARVVKDKAVFSIPIGGGISQEHLREYTPKKFIDLLKDYFIIQEQRTFLNDKGVKILVVICKKI